ncbi:MAG TPA: 23S rRNA (guanosine(2251)-2'-O)-methyltransferase RlmB [Terriglobales bacterium]|nr:23S rRNA (guanosine(2251)-2'-O)-methyltransferase RlmB [Terriglobales bacterium]
MAQEVIYGIHPVAEAVQARARTVEYVAVAKDRRDSKIQQIVDDCRKAGVSVRFVPREDLARLAQTQSNQGIAAVVASRRYADVDDLVQNKRGQHAFVVVLDGVEDPHNLGAILRTADGAGADGVVIPERRAVGITGTVAKASAGASEWLPIARVTNISRTIEELKSRNIWVVGLDERGTQAYDEIDYNMDCALVLGAEGAGVHELVRKKCDFLVSIPMLGKVPSLNVSVAAAVVMYEVARQRRKTSRSSAEKASKVSKA